MIMGNDRFLRHSLIDWFSQEDVHKSRIAVVGAGAVGNEVIKNLVLLGVGNIDIYDFDCIEIHNLTRSIFFRSSDIGQPKADVAMKRAKELDSNLNINSFHGEVWEKLSIKNLVNYNCVISCVDNFEARLNLNSLCYLYNVDFINTGIDSRYVSIEVFPFGRNHDIACYECNLPDSVYARMSDRYSCGWLKKVSFKEKVIPTTIITSSIAGASAASCALRLGDCSHDINAYKLLYDTIANTMSKNYYVKNTSCIVCDKPSERVCITPSKFSRDYFTDIDINKANNITITCSEQVIVSAQCNTCGDMKEHLAFTKVRDYTDAIIICDKCKLRSVEIKIRDQFDYKELIECFDKVAIPAKYLYAVVDNCMFLINTEEDRSE